MHQPDNSLPQWTRGIQVFLQEVIVVPAEVHERDVIETPNALASTAVTAPDILDVEPRAISSRRISLS